MSHAARASSAALSLPFLLGTALGLGGSATAAAEPRCSLRGQPYLEGRVRSAPGSGAVKPTATARAVDARLGQEIEVFVNLPGLLAGRPVIFSEDGAPGHVSWTASGCEPISVAWSRLETKLAHIDTPAPNAGLRCYSNAVIFGPRHGKWIGYDQLEYLETPIAEASGLSLVVNNARPQRFWAPRAADHEGLGSMRLTATVRTGSQELHTKGMADAARGQIDERVFRYSFRNGDGFIGWLTSFYNVPYLFGSAGEGAHNQADRYIGADCADVLVAALRRAGLPRLSYTNVSGVIAAVGKLRSEAVVKSCPGPLASCTTVSDPPIAIGSEVKPGDIIAVQYLGADELPRALDHIVVLVEDSGPSGKPDGVLGPHDLVVDSGDERALKFAPLSEQGDVRVVIGRARGVPVF